jgi:hypothetical protein
MNKSYWKQRAKAAEREAEGACERAAEAQKRAYALRQQVDDLTREVEDKRKNWAPIKIKHPYVAHDAGCIYCDDPAEDPRHELPGDQGTSA